MALTGTLRDFGIADILQLIGQQQKTGVLHLQAKDQAVNVHFVDGNVVRAESTTRNRKDLLGSMMVRAEVLTEAELEQALDIQKRTLRRLGDILVSEGMVPRDVFRELYQLQTTETLYRLFHWKDGTYNFEQQEVDFDPEAIAPIRSENVLMEGFRMVDEWPMVRRKITSYEMTFAVLKPLAPPTPAAQAPQAEEIDPFDAALDQALSGGGGGGDADPEVGPGERRVFELVVPGRTVQEIIDRSRLGEFDTCKALLNLIEAEVLSSLAPAKKGAAPVGGVQRDLAGSLRRLAVQAAMGVGVLAGVVVLAWFAVGAEHAMGRRFEPRSAQDLLASAQEARLGQAIRVYRYRQGHLPAHLADLVKAGLVGEADLSYPYGSVYSYQRDPQRPEGYLLLPPLP